MDFRFPICIKDSFDRKTLGMTKRKEIYEVLKKLYYESKDKKDQELPDLFNFLDTQSQDEEEIDCNKLEN